MDATYITIFPDLWVGIAHSQYFGDDAVGIGPFTFVLSVGSLPSGMTLVDDLFSGTPTTAGSYSFTLDITDTGDSSTTTKVLSGTVREGAPVVQIDKSAPGTDRPGVEETQNFGPWEYGGALYCLVCRPVVASGGVVGHTGSMLVFESTDNGATWTVQDLANSPAGYGGAVAINGSTLTCTYKPYTGQANGTIESYPAYDYAWSPPPRNWGPTPTYDTLRLVDFSLETKTWGSDYAVAGSDPSLAPSFDTSGGWLPNAHRRSNGDILIAGLTTDPVHQYITVAILTAATGTWSFVDISTGVGDSEWPAYGKLAIRIISSCLDASDRLHVFLTANWRPLGGPVTGIPVKFRQIGGSLYYQALEADNTLGHAYAFPNPNPLLVDDRGASYHRLLSTIGYPIGIPVAVGDTLVVPVVCHRQENSLYAYPTLYTATPLSNPAWTLMASTDGVDADSGRPGAGFPRNSSEGPMLLMGEGSKLWYVFLRDGAGIDANGLIGRQIRVAWTLNADPTLGWGSTAQTVFDSEVDTGPDTYASSMFSLRARAIGSGLGIAVDTNGTGGRRPAEMVIIPIITTSADVYTPAAAALLVTGGQPVGHIPPAPGTPSPASLLITGGQPMRGHTFVPAPGQFRVLGGSPSRNPSINCVVGAGSEVGPG